MPRAFSDSPYIHKDFVAGHVFVTADEWRTLSLCLQFAAVTHNPTFFDIRY